LSARNPSVYEWAEQSGAIAEWINIWSDESEIAPDIYAERWRPGDAAPSVSSHPWKSYAWPAVVAGVAQGGAAGLPKSERIEVAAAARPGHTSSSDRKETRKSTIDMLLAKEEGGVRPVQGGDAAASAEFSEIGDTGWVMEKLKEFAYVNVGGEIASWAQGDALVRVSYKKGNTGRAQHAEEECKRKGYKSQQIAFRGALAKVCNQIPFSSVSSQRIDIFTIVSPEFFISVYYQYADDSARSTHLPMYTKAVEALRPKKK